MKVKVRDVHPNPYRNIEHYPLNKEKIMALTKSIEKTGFWDNLVGREQDGKIQIAYGHHRIEALRLAEGCGYDYEFDLPVRDIDNGTMIKIMANENMQEWEHSTAVTDETVKVTKKFLNEHAQLGREVQMRDVKDFLGWTLNKVQVSWSRLSAIDSGKVSPEAVVSFQSEDKSKNFLQAAKKHNFSLEEQEDIAKELIEKDVSRNDFSKVFRAKAFEKKHGKDFGQKKKEKEDKQLKEFDQQLAVIADDISSLSDKFLKLTTLKNELESVTSKKGLFNLKILFMAYGNLKTRMDKFEKAMTENTEDITEEFLEEVKQLNK